MGSVIPLKKSANSAYLELKNMLRVNFIKMYSVVMDAACYTKFLHSSYKCLIVFNFNSIQMIAVIFIRQGFIIDVPNPL